MSPCPASTPIQVQDGARWRSGVADPGESWAAAARRICGAGPAPVPGDLSGARKQFVVDRDLHVELRAMTHDDLGDVVAWRTDPGVRRWWSDAVRTRGDALRHYGPRIEGRSPVTVWVVEAGGRPVGLVQDYRVGDLAEHVGPDPDAIGVDYAIGVPAWRGRGLGVRIVWAWMSRTHQRLPLARTLLAAPDHRHTASLRVLARAGFTRGATSEELGPDGAPTTVVACTLDVPTVIG